MPSNSNSGTISATVGVTPDVLATVSTAGNYLFKINMENMTLGDSVFIEMFDKVLTTSNSGRVYGVPYNNGESDDVVVSIPMSVVFEMVVQITQTAGTSRDFDWAVVDMS